MILHGNCVEVMAEMAPNSVDAIVTDPPYGLEFMGKEWDRLGDDAVSKSWDSKGRRDNVPNRQPDSPGGRHAAHFKTQNPRCRICGRAVHGRDTAKGFKVCSCEQPDIYQPNTYPIRMQAWHEEWAREAFRVIKPGGRLLAFGGTRTYHRMVCAIEDAGFVIEDTIAWLYGSGFPKHKSKLKPAHEPVVVAWKPDAKATPLNIDACRIGTGDRIHSPGPNGGMGGDAWRLTEGRDDRMPVAYDPSPLGRWPANVCLDHEAAALLDAQSGERRSSGDYPTTYSNTLGYGGNIGKVQGPLYADSGGPSRFFFVAPPNPEDGIIDTWNHDIAPSVNNHFDHDAKLVDIAPSPARAGIRTDQNSPEPTTNATPNGSKPNGKSGTPTIPSSGQKSSPELPRGNGSNHGLARIAAQSTQTAITTTTESRSTFDSSADLAMSDFMPNDSEAGAADLAGSRFIYTAKASRRERNAGLSGLPERENRNAIVNDRQRCITCGKWYPKPMRIERRPNSTCTCDDPVFETLGTNPGQNHHPTVKPVALMAWLIRLVAKPGDTVLDPFMGSGSTGCAAALEGVSFIGIEMSEEYIAIAERRIAHWTEHGADALKVLAPVAPRTARVYASGNGRRSLPRCPVHGAGQGNGVSRDYRCGCRLVYAEGSPAVTDLPLFAAVAD